MRFEISSWSVTSMSVTERAGMPVCALTSLLEWSKMSVTSWDGSETNTCPSGYLSKWTATPRYPVQWSPEDVVSLQHFIVALLAIRMNNYSLPILIVNPVFYFTVQQLHGTEKLDPCSIQELLQRRNPGRGGDLFRLNLIDSKCFFHFCSASPGFLPLPYKLFRKPLQALVPNKYHSHSYQNCKT